MAGYSVIVNHWKNLLKIKIVSPWEQKENRAGDTGTKAVHFREQGTPKSEKTF